MHRTAGRRRAALVLLLTSALLSLVGGSTSRAATQTGIGIGPPESLLRGIEFLNTGGTYYQANSVDEEGLKAQLTIELPGAPTDAVPGAVVVFWQLVVSVTDNQFGDVSERAIGPPNRVVLAPECETPASCVISLHASAPLSSAFEADELDWVLSTWVAIRFTAVRTFGDGAFLQAVAPQVGWNVGNGWTITDPADIEGTLISAAVIPAGEATPAYLASEEFHVGNDALFDWGSAASEALSEPLPVEAGDAATEPGALLPRVLALILFGAGAGALTFWYRRSARRHAPTGDPPPIEGIGL